MFKGFNQFKKYLCNDKGMALVTVLIISTVLSMVGASHLSTSTHEAGLITDQIQEAQTLHAAESGINYARQRLTTWSEWDSDWSVSSLKTGVAGVTTDVSFNSTTDTIISSCTNGSQSKTITMVVTASRHNPFDHATCGCSEVNFNGASVTVDSYIYTPSGGGYIDGHGGNVGSNGDVNLGGATIDGNIVATGALTGTGTVGIEALSIGDVTLGSNRAGMTGDIWGTVLENEDPPPSPCDCDALKVADAVDDLYDSDGDGVFDPSNTDNSKIYSICPGCMNGSSMANPGTKFSTNSNLELPAGDYYFSEFTIGGSAEVTIAAGAQVRIFFGDKQADGTTNTSPNRFKFTGGGLVNGYDNTDNLKIFSSSSEDIKISGGPTFAGSIFAPSAEIKFSGGTNFYGAVIGDVSTMSGTVNFYYDASLADQPIDDDIDGVVTVEVNSWSQD